MGNLFENLRSYQKKKRNNISATMDDTEINESRANSFRNPIIGFSLSL